MSLKRRLRDMTVATLNEKLEVAEDPVRMIDRYLAEQKKQIQASERLYQQCLAHAHAMQEQFLSAARFKEKRENQALLAMKAGEEEIARLALQEKIQYEEKSEQYEALFEQSKLSLIELEDQLQQLRVDHQEVSEKREFYLARLQSVRLQQQMNESMRNRSGEIGTETRSFHRMEEKMSELEWETRSLRELRRKGQEMFAEMGNVMKGSQAILEHELQVLRDKLKKEGGWKA